MQVENKKVETKTKKSKRRRRKNLGFLKYIFLFAFVFIGALVGLSYLVDSYSPKVDVSLGNTDDSLTLATPENEEEMKTIDERLKWIQMEDEMPSVAIRETLAADELASTLITENHEQVDKKEVKENLNEKAKSKEPIDSVVLDVVQPKSEAPKPAMSEIAKQTTDFRTAAKQAVIPAPIPSLTKVFLGPFSTLDEAIFYQQKVGNDLPEVMPFVKSVDGSYIVQIGSFSNKEVANSFLLKAQEKGYSPKTKTEN